MAPWGTPGRAPACLASSFPPCPLSCACVCGVTVPLCCLEELCDFGKADSLSELRVESGESGLGLLWLRSSERPFLLPVQRGAMGGTLAFPAAAGDPQPPPTGIRRRMSSQRTRSVQPVNTLPGPGVPVGMPPSGAALGGSPEAQGCQRQGHLPSALPRKWGPWGCAHACVHVNMCSWVCGCACVYRGGVCTYVSIRACVFYVYPCVYVSVHVCVWHVILCAVYVLCMCVDAYGWTGSRSPS